MRKVQNRNCEALGFQWTVTVISNNYCVACHLYNGYHEML